jgi:hypothetical protein
VKQLGRTDHAPLSAAATLWLPAWGKPVGESLLTAAGPPLSYWPFSWRAA